MADDIVLDNVSQSDFDSAESTLISLVRAAYPSLDLRRGTVMRDVLIRPAASIYALNAKYLLDLQQKMSLIAIQANPDATASDVDAILANFGVTRNSGSKATGQVIVRVNGNRIYVLGTATQFRTLTGLTYQVTANYTVRQIPNPGELQLYTSSDGTYYYFIVPVIAAVEGATYNITQGTALDAVTAIYGYVSSEAYVDFSTGVDPETINQIVARLPAAVSYKALESRTSIDAKLRANFDGTAIQIQATSSQGYGDAAQLRDKHNPIGFAVGSRVDIYARTFVSPNIVTLTKEAQLIAPNTYQFTIGRSELPGFYAIRSISEMESTLGASVTGLPVIGSYAFVEVRSASGIESTFHDIDPDNSMIETAYSVFQQSVVTVTGVPNTTATRTFKVEVYTAPGLADLQNFVDGSALRNLEGDYIVRCPLICLVSLDAKAYHNADVDIDVEAMRQDVFNYINTRSFVPRLTRSELACIMHSDGATRIDLGVSGMMLQGIVRDAAGTVLTLQGDSLELTQIEAPKHMLTTNTVVFAAELGNIHIEAVAE